VASSEKKREQMARTTKSKKVSRKSSKKSSSRTKSISTRNKSLRKDKSAATPIQLKVLTLLVITTLFLGGISVAKAQGFFIPVISEIVPQDNIIFLEDMSLEEKIAQMVITHGGMHNKDNWQKLQLGGIHLFAKETKEQFKDTITQFQTDMKIPFFVTSDLEGCINSFANFKEFTPNNEITTVEEAQNKAIEEADFLKDLGFNINFAPVVDLEDSIWGCRAFPGDHEQITTLAQTYTTTLQDNGVSATIKHYPGKTLIISDPHKNLVEATIDENDLYPYENLQDPDFVMVSHLIIDGLLNSNERPSSVSTEIMLPLKESHPNLIVSDDILMLGLQNFYQDNTDQLYIDLVLAGHDVILNFDEDPNEIYHMIQVIAENVESGIIEQEQIDTSVTKILELKGFTVI